MDHFKLFIIIPPGLEDLALKELERKCPVDNYHQVKGGLEIEANLDWIERAHTLLKIPTRILMRLTDYKVRDFPKLHQKMLKFSWNKYLSHPTPNWEITCSKSRINHTGRIEETLNDALKSALIKQPLSKDWEKKNYSPQTFYIRIVDDHLTLSLDLTGLPLYKRGLQTIKGEAPIRENLASALLMDLFEDIKIPVTLIDPMCGSGTFLTEALTFHRPLHYRSFSFEEAPFYKGKILKRPEETQPLPISKVLGLDLNHELLAKVEEELKSKDLDIHLQHQNSLEKKIEANTEIFMICNPPYGERIKINGKRGVFLKEAWSKFLKLDRPLRFGWILPSDMDDLFSNHPDYKVKTKRHLKNGGMAVTFWVWERND